MRKHASVSHLARAVIAAGLGLVVSLSGLAGDRGSGATLTVAVFADRYVAAEVPFADFDALDALVKPVNPSLLRLLACGPGSTDALLAAAERYRDSPLALGVLGAEEADCVAAASIGSRPVLLAGTATPDRLTSKPNPAYWQSVMP